MRQRFYLRFPYSKRAVCSGFPEFAAYFRRAFPEVRGKTEICRPDPYFELPRPAVLLQKNRLGDAVSDFSPHFRKMRQNRASGSGKRAKCTPSQDAIKKGMPSIWKEPPCRTSANERLLFFVAIIAWHVDNHLDMTVMPNAPQPSSGTIDRSLR